MVLSKRERYIAIATGIVLALLVMDALVLTPLHEKRTALEDQIQIEVSRMEYVNGLLERRKQLAPQWRAMLEEDLKSSTAEAESAVLHAVRDWSQEAGLSLSSLRPERNKLIPAANDWAQEAGLSGASPGSERKVTKENSMEEITFRASGTGRMRAVARFLWRLESSSLPVRVSDLQIGTRNEGMDDLSLQVRISALCLPEEARPVALATSNATGSEE